MLQTRNRELINEIKAIYLITGLAIRDPTIRQANGFEASSAISGLLNMTSSYFFIGICICLGSLGLGAVAYERWLSRVIAWRKKLAHGHPLRRVALSNKDELQVWRWLEEVFPDQHVLLRMPLTSFTEPNNLEGDAHWQALLSSVSFACVVCNAQGMVLGCVDVLDRGEVLNRKHAFKRELLGRASIAYWIVENRTRPDTAMLRKQFLNFVPHSDKKRLKRARPASALTKPIYFTRMGSSASEMSRAGISAQGLNSSLQLGPLVQAWRARFSKSPHPLTSPAYLGVDSMA